MVVVDDIEMRISHVIRGEDHLSNTPKHVLLFRALGAEPPVFAHLPLILNPDRSKMSKRKSQTAIDAYREQGYIREAIVNHLALLGWSSGSDEEVFGMDDLVARFDLGRVQPSGAIFDLARLDWLNGQWTIRRLPSEELTERALPFLAEALAAESAEGHAHAGPRPTTWHRCCPWSSSACRAWMPSAPCSTSSSWRTSRSSRPCSSPSAGMPPPRQRRWRPPRASSKRAGRSASRPTSSTPPLRGLCEAQGWKVGDLFMAIRVAVTGRTATPPLFDTMMAIGYERTLGRLQAAVESLRAGGGDELEGQAR